MDVRHLQTVVVLSEELHFGRAATRLHVGQSTVSQALRAIEDEIGTPLFARTRRKVTTTSAGVAFVTHARAALAAIADAKTSANRAAAGAEGKIRLMFTLMSALTPLPRAIVRFRNLMPAVEISVTSAGSAAQLEAIRLGRCDVGFITYRPETRPLASMQVSREPLTTLLHDSHRLAGRRSVRLSDLANEPIVMLSAAAEPTIATYYRLACQQAGFEPKVVVEVEQIDTLLAFVSAGLGLSHAPASVMQLRFPGVSAVPLVPRIDSGITAVWDAEQVSPAALRFLEVLRDELR